jgi:hypothetical protein
MKVKRNVLGLVVFTLMITIAVSMQAAGAKDVAPTKAGLELYVSTKWVCGGRYELKQSLAFTAEDSGTVEAPVVWAARPQEEVRIAAGRMIPEFKPVSDAAVLDRLPVIARGNVLQADFKAMGISEFGEMSGGFGMEGRPGIELFINDEPMWVARYPNKGFMRVSGALGKTEITSIGQKGQKEWIVRTDDKRVAGRVTAKGREITFTSDQVIAGCIRVSGGTGPNPVERLGRDLALLPLFGGGNLSAFENAGLQPDDLGLMPFPGRDASQRPALQASNAFFMMGKDVLHRGGRAEADRKGYRDAVWNVMTIICSSEGQDEAIRESVAAGKARFINPRDLRRLGFDEYLQELPPEQLALWDRLDRGEIMEVVEPLGWGPRWF